MSRCHVSGGANWNKPLTYKQLTEWPCEEILKHHGYGSDWPQWSVFLKDVGHTSDKWPDLYREYQSYCILRSSPLGQALL